VLAQTEGISGSQKGGGETDHENTFLWVGSGAVEPSGGGETNALRTSPIIRTIYIIDTRMDHPNVARTSLPSSVRRQPFLRKKKKDFLSSIGIRFAVCSHPFHSHPPPTHPHIHHLITPPHQSGFLSVVNSTTGFLFVERFIGWEGGRTAGSARALSIMAMGEGLMELSNMLAGLNPGEENAHEVKGSHNAVLAPLGINPFLASTTIPIGPSVAHP
jgi:hypothetical protein